MINLVLTNWPDFLNSRTEEYFEQIKKQHIFLKKFLAKKQSE